MPMLSEEQRKYYRDTYLTKSKEVFKVLRQSQTAGTQVLLASVKRIRKQQEKEKQL